MPFFGTARLFDATRDEISEKRAANFRPTTATILKEEQDQFAKPSKVAAIDY
jgi:hypothetical protein